MLFLEWCVVLDTVPIVAVVLRLTLDSSGIIAYLVAGTLTAANVDDGSDDCRT